MDRTIIKKVSARQVFSGRGYPAVEATIETCSGKRVQCNVCRDFQSVLMRWPLHMMGEPNGEEWG